MAKNILIFTGNGKGKSTAAFGMALRAAGHDQRILVLQFLKSDDSTGELVGCKQLGIEVKQVGRGFVPKKDNPAYRDHQKAAEAGFEQAINAMQGGEYDLLVLDEICGTVALGLLDEDVVLNAIRESSDLINVVLTGRNASPPMIELADTVSEMVPHKHALEAGKPAREGVEF